MKKGTEVRGKIEYTDFPNKGVMKADGERVTVKGTLPGQNVRAVINKGRKGRFEARLLEVEEKSELETELPFCPSFGICGGCTYQTLPYDVQIELKAGQVKKLLDGVVKPNRKKVLNGDEETENSGISDKAADGKKIGELGESSEEKEYADRYLFEKPIPSPKQWEYRNKMEFTFGNEYKDGEVVLGLHKKGSFYDIVPAAECKIIHPDMREILAATADFARNSGYGFYHKMTKQGFFRHLLVRRAERTGELLVDIVTTTQEGPDLELWAEKLKKLPCAEKIAGILHTKNDSLADAVIDQGTELLFGKDHITEEILDLKFKITPFSFFQTNSLGAELLYAKVRDYVGVTKDKVIFDLYSGTGTIGQLLAPVAKKVIGIEIVEEAVEAARENARANGLSNCEFLAGDVLKMLDGINEKPDFIVLDPPREGINPKALGKILNYGVRNMVYISCKPTSLAHDLVAIQEAGYEVEKACCVDMFPGNGNVETVCLLSNRKPDARVKIDVDLEDYYRIKDSEKTSE